LRVDRRFAQSSNLQFAINLQFAMPKVDYIPWLHRFAVSTVCMAMITLIAGALVTSNNAGMAFPDWPTSDGHDMLTYPWLADFARDGDRFLEHGHRLAGMLIGMWSIALFVLVTRFERRRWVKLAAAGVLLGVIGQGILGGFRVWFDQRGLALLHGALAACVLSLMAVVATALSRDWRQMVSRPPASRLRLGPFFGLLTVAVLALQFLLGSLIRHQGTGLFEHLGLGILAVVVVVANAVVAQSSGTGWLQRSGWTLLAVVMIQVGLGGAAWVTRFGFAQAGYVAVADSIPQIVFRTAHTVVGSLVIMTAVGHAVRTQRVTWMVRAASGTASLSSLSPPVSVTGGVA
jgi:cytochrome c oxidase assembly protein subunit 15